MIEFIVEGKPVGMATKKSRDGHLYLSPSTRQYEKLIKGVFFVNYGIALKPLVGPVGMRLKTVYPIPKSTSKANRKKMLSGIIAPTCKPDLSNVIKSVEDALKGLAYRDDAEIIGISATKQYGENPRVEIQIQEI